MSQKDYCHLTLLLDASDSMWGHGPTLCRSAIKFLQEQKEVRGSMTVSLSIFNHDVTRCIWHFVSIDEAIQLIDSRYVINGGTALFDAVGFVTADVAKRINLLADANQPEKVIFAIITDGEDSGASKTYKPGDIKTMVSYHERTYSWEFLYIGANQDAYKTGKQFGIQAGKALSFAISNEGLTQAVDAVSNAVTRYRNNGAPHANQFFQADDHMFQRELGASSAPMSNE